MKPIEMVSVICDILVFLSGAILLFIFKKHPSADASRVEKWLTLILGIIFLFSGLLAFVLEILCGIFA